MALTPAQKAAQQRWQKKNKDKLNAYARAWRAKNAEKVAAYQKRWQQDNSDKFKAAVKRWQQDNPTAMLGAALKHKYGITVEAYDAKVRQQHGVCAICGQPPGRKKLSVDHCHTTGKIRGLLCILCNTALGKFKDDPRLLQSAINYLFFHS